jgi:clan AA aspartic protease
MITGVVRSLEPRIRLRVRGPDGRTRVVQAIVDTGFTASLTLPTTLVAYLGLPWQRVGRTTLGDGTECEFDVYEATVVWDGQIRQIVVDEAETDPLLGMALLNGYRLDAEIRSGGKVRIERLEPRKSRSRA